MSRKLGVGVVALTALALALWRGGDEDGPRPPSRPLHVTRARSVAPRFQWRDDHSPPDGAPIREPQTERAFPSEDAPDDADQGSTPDTVEVEEEFRPTRDFVRDTVTRALAQHKPGLQIPSGRFESLIDAVMKLHEARLEIARLGEATWSAARLRELRDREWRAAAEAREIAGIGATDVPGLFGASGGIDSPAEN